MCLRSNLKRELGFTLRLSPDDERDNDTQAEQDSESDDIPARCPSPNRQQAEAENQQTWKKNTVQKPQKNYQTNS